MEGFSYVDEVVIFDEDSPRRLIQQIKPDILVKGGDYDYKGLGSRHLVDTVVIYNSTKVDISTTKILNHGYRHGNNEQAKLVDM